MAKKKATKKKALRPVDLNIISRDLLVVVNALLEELKECSDNLKRIAAALEKAHAPEPTQPIAEPEDDDISERVDEPDDSEPVEAEESSE